MSRKKLDLMRNVVLHDLWRAERVNLGIGWRQGPGWSKGLAMIRMD